ncbi:MAG: HAMP domain-containing histidine kinase, partial [Psychrosphaera sp.]|nr:HAMP domain-containing histidine kinase [Psychrosphaera sp.]
KVAERTNELVHAEKMASLGTLTAGVAHEINNPTNFVHVSTQNLMADLETFQTFIFDLAGEDADEEILESFRQQFKPLYQHLETIKDGTERIKIIVQDLRAFTQLDSATHKTVVITDCLQSTINLVRTKNQAVARFVTEFESTPELLCFPAQLNQVFMNLIVNACDAIREKLRQQNLDTPGQVTVGCRTLDNAVEITVKDDGCGMSDVTKNKLFEPFYTTKDVGEGTGLGLSISYGIVQKHDGELTVESELGVGSSFTLLLPIQKPSA